MDWNGNHVTGSVNGHPQRGIVLRMSPVVATQLALVIRALEQAGVSPMREDMTEVKQALDFLLIERSRAVPSPRRGEAWPASREASAASLQGEFIPPIGALEALRSFHPEEK